MPEVINIISTVGFPIAMCLCLMWFVKYMMDTHKEESKEFTTALNNNTVALQKLISTLEKGATSPNEEN